MRDRSGFGWLALIVSILLLRLTYTKCIQEMPDSLDEE